MEAQLSSGLLPAQQPTEAQGLPAEVGLPIPPALPPQPALPGQPQETGAGDAAEALAALQGPQHDAAAAVAAAAAAAAIAAAGAAGAAPQAAVLPAAQGGVGRVPGMGRGSSLFRGVSKAGDKKRWRAMIQYNHEQHHIGYYDTAEEAARAYDRQAIEFMGGAAATNFPLSDYANGALADLSTEEMRNKRKRTSQFRGVSKAGAKWKATITANGSKLELGRFDTELEAAQAYDQAALDAWGLAAQLNLAAPGVPAVHGGAVGAQLMDTSMPLAGQLPGMMLHGDGGAAAAVAASQAAMAAGLPMHGTPVAGGMPGLLQGGVMRGARYMGVTPFGGKWQAKVEVDLGKFESAEEAARAHDRAAVWCLGLTATTNYPVTDALRPGPSDFVLAAANGAHIPYAPPAPHAAPPAAAEAFDGGEAAAAAAEAAAAAAAAQQQHDAEAQAAAHDPPPPDAAGGAMAATTDAAPYPIQGGDGAGAAEATAVMQLVALASAMAGATSNGGGASALLAYAAQLAAGPFPGAGGAEEEAPTMGEEAPAPMSAAAVEAGAGDGSTPEPMDASGGFAYEPAAAAAAVAAAAAAAAQSGLRDPHAAISAVVGPREPRRAKASFFQGLSKKFNRWKALIKINGKRKELASFPSEAKAARCYDLHATLAWGARARTNFNQLELLCDVDREARLIVDIAAEGGRTRDARTSQRRPSQVVADALQQRAQGGIDSSTQEGQAAHAALAAELGPRPASKRSRFRGVCSNWNRWRAQIYVAGRRRELGSFATEAEAARVYDLAAISMYGAENAATNFPVAEYTARLAAAGIAPPGTAAGAESDATAVLMAALANAVQEAPAGPEGSDAAPDAGNSGNGVGGDGADGSGGGGPGGADAGGGEMRAPAFLAQMMAATADVGAGAGAPPLS
ncbi:hypothetical protein WJX81_006742 [Elliptochloris bilobata]|uniref:AP2/ERF domain-containing protein n=1 Tax=Elliptochloris bilobata TaxID=381761 RepID=A0AAW1SI13_9CHLO